MTAARPQFAQTLETREVNLTKSEVALLSVKFAFFWSFKYEILLVLIGGGAKLFDKNSFNFESSNNWNNLSE